MNKSNWCIIRTQSGREKSVAERLERERNDGDLFGKINKILVPTEHVLSIKDKKTVKKEKILYRGYVFVEVYDIGTLKDSLNMIKGASGFLKSRSSEVEKLRQSEIDNMIGVQKDNNEKDIENLYIVGEEVTITDGPFNSMKGTIDKIVNDKIKLSVLIFGRKTSVDLNIDQISKV